MEYLFLMKSELVLANLPCPPAPLLNGTLRRGPQDTSFAHG